MTLGLWGAAAPATPCVSPRQPSCAPAQPPQSQQTPRVLAHRVSTLPEGAVSHTCPFPACWRPLLQNLFVACIHSSRCTLNLAHDPCSFCLQTADLQTLDASVKAGEEDERDEDEDAQSLVFDMASGGLKSFSETASMHGDSQRGTPSKPSSLHGGMRSGALAQNSAQQNFSLASSTSGPGANLICVTLDAGSMPPGAWGTRSYQAGGSDWVAAADRLYKLAAVTHCLVVGFAKCRWGLAASTPPHKRP